MDPTTIFCPNLVRPARGKVGKGYIGIHSRQEQRFVCRQCGKISSATKGTVFYRLRTPSRHCVAGADPPCPWRSTARHRRHLRVRRAHRRCM